MSRTSVNSITVRLLKPNLDPEDGLSPKYGPSGAKELKGQDWEGGGEGILYYGQMYDRTPEWLAQLEPHIPDPLGSLHSSGSAAILFLYVQNRWMAICFGYAHLALEDDAFVHQFGLKVALNTVPRGSLLSLDLATPDAVTFQKRIQASKLSDFSQFGMDTLRDLARVAGGQPSDNGFAKFVAGKDALSLDAPLAPSEFHDKCAEILEAYQSITYKRDYAWFDNVREETSSERLKILDRRLYSEIRAIRRGANSLLHMSPPEILDYQEGAQLGYTGFGSRKSDFTKLSITDYVEELNRLNCVQTMDATKSSHRVRSVSKKSGESIGWKVYDCLNWEYTLTKPTPTHYVLFAGKWYEVSATFKDLVEKHFDTIPDFSIFGRTSCLNEEELIADITDTRPDLIKLDRTKINPKGVTSGNLEPCDFYSNDRIFIHLKDGGSSGPISHLWMQGVVSAEAFVADNKFRTKLKDTVSKTKGGYAFLKSLPDGRKSDFNRSDYTVVYGIMRQPYKGGSLGIPFFSKVSFMAACDRLRRTGMKIGKELIEKIPPTSGASTKTKKAKAATKTRTAKPSKAPSNAQ